MKKNYCPVKIKNPSSKNSLVQLLSGQKMNIFFDGKDYQDYKIDISGTFLKVDEVSETSNGWMTSISQKKDIIKYNESALFLGGINFFDGNNENKSSLCVVSNHKNDDYLRVINPKNISCNLRPNQVLDVVVHSDIAEKWQCFISCGDLHLELIQNSTRVERNICDGEFDSQPAFEYFFRFRFDQKSIEYLSELPFSKYDGGHIIFINSNNEKRIIKVYCSWRGKSSIYKALLLPKIPTTNINFLGKKPKKCFHSVVVVSIIKSEELEFGCNVLFSKVEK